MLRSMRRKRRYSILTEDDGDPLSVVVNLFDVAMVFAVSLMVAMVMHMNMAEMFGKDDFTIVKNPGKENMEIIQKKGWNHHGEYQKGNFPEGLQEVLHA